MIGISGAGKENIAKIVDDMFDRIALSFLGNIPRFKNKKLMVFSTSPNLGLSHLFVQAMQNKVPNALEQEVLKGLLISADGYIESLKNKTRANITEAVDGMARQADLMNDKIDSKMVEKLIENELAKAKVHIKTIIESEATKLRNLGTLMDITRVAASVNDDDPTVFFQVVRDATTCKECVKLHIMPDGVTPRLWKFSELKQGYHKRGEVNPSAFGLHPHCRCTLTYLSKGFGFNDKGEVGYQAEKHDAFSKQRK